MTWVQVDRGELLERSAHDPYVRWALPSEVIAVASDQGWACVAPWRRGRSHWGGVAVVRPWAGERAESEAFAALAELADRDGVSVEWFSTHHERGLVIPAGYVTVGAGSWDFLWTDDVPAADGSVAFHELHDGDDATLISTFGHAHNPAFEGFPGHGHASLWLAVRDDAGDLVALGGVHELASGIPHLSGIVVHTAHRGRGLGRALTAELTRRAIEEAGVSTLGVYSDNMPALRLYERLGYRTAHRFTTRSLATVADAG
ncbi:MULTISPECIES: GNAT family N-acetyltransferase [unclassified Ornithinimicrobium]|uniref:GNAT family N-acetyltransferase n=1 Tax=unclassified Ornithinimicrobium TaxID=2615080 RepID=UPI003853F36D